MEFDLNDKGEIGTRAQILFLATKLFLTELLFKLPPSVTQKEAAFPG